MFGEGDLNYLANLCHNCGECYYACQYAPPHEFAVNVPKILAEIRTQSYRQYAWPAFLAKAFEANGLVVSVVLAMSLALALLLASRQNLFLLDAGGDFYRVVPHGVMAYAFGGVAVFGFVAFGVGFLRFWRNAGERLSAFTHGGALAKALKDALSLRYLDGGGGGCTYPGDRQSQSRRWFHHLTFYGFLFCFASTSTAAFYHYALGRKAPYAWLSVPVVLGTLGGIALAAGTAGLWWLKQKRNPETQDGQQYGMDAAFIAILLFASVSGLLLLALRESAAMGILLVIHLGIVLALFLTLPYGKFVHGIYRSAALVKNALESQKSKPS
jgi:citrate/tricarballylate utilization protein